MTCKQRETTTVAVHECVQNGPVTVVARVIERDYVKSPNVHLEAHAPDCKEARTR